MLRSDPKYKSVRQKILDAVMADPGRRPAEVLIGIGLCDKGSAHIALQRLEADGLLRREYENPSRSRVYPVVKKGKRRA